MKTMKKRLNLLYSLLGLGIVVMAAGVILFIVH